MTSNVKEFINKYNWKGINYPSEVDDWERFDKNNLTIFLINKKKKILPAYISKHNLPGESQIILLMIPNKEKVGWHYVAVKNYLHYFIETLQNTMVVFIV